jgi:hypothetical protein
LGYYARLLNYRLSRHGAAGILLFCTILLSLAKTGPAKKNKRNKYQEAAEKFHFHFVKNS